MWFSRRESSLVSGKGKFHCSHITNGKELEICKTNCAMKWWPLNATVHRCLFPEEERVKVVIECLKLHSLFSKQNAYKRTIACAKPCTEIWEVEVKLENFSSWELNSNFDGSLTGVKLNRTLFLFEFNSSQNRVRAEFRARTRLELEESSRLTRFCTFDLHLLTNLPMA